MKSLFFLILLVPIFSFAQKNSLSVIGGINYTITSYPTNYYEKEDDGSFNIFPGIGGQLGWHYKVEISEKIKFNGLLEVQQRNSFMQKGIILTDNTGVAYATLHPSIKNTVLCPSALIGLVPKKSFEFGAGLSVPVLLYSYSKLDTRLYTTDTGETKRFQNHYFKTASLNLNLYFQLNISERVSLKASYYRGITSRTINSKEYGNLFAITTAIRLTGK
jgi:hypothetical protein